MKTRFLNSILALALLPTSATFGQATAEKVATAKKDNARVCIWEIRDEDNTVYLAGSVHLLREKDLPIPDAYEEVYEKVSEVIFEVDMAEMTNPAVALKMQQLGALPPGEKLADHISEETFAKLEAFLKGMQLPPAMLMGMKPGMAFLTISSLQAMKSGARADLGLEMQCYARCKKDGKDSRGLETLEYQIGRFDALGKDELDKLLAKAIEDAEESDEKLEELIGAWKQGDAENLAKIIDEEMNEEDRVKELLLTERNANWIPEIEEAIAGSKNVMFLVGAAHLVGEGSVVDMLSKKGIQAKQLGVLSQVEKE